MALMKKDMGGAAAALATAQLLRDLDVPLDLRVLVPAVENSVDGNAQRPGDVWRSRKGLTVEITNTDAEGRLVLADALTLAAEDEPDLIVDFATLTGAARVALGPELPPVYGGDPQLVARPAAEPGSALADPLWPMPLWEPYDEDLASRIADLNHAPAGGMAGSITAALFLRRFVPAPQRWIHLDIYGWNPARSARQAAGRRSAGNSCRRVCCIATALRMTLHRRVPRPEPAGRRAVPARAAALAAGRAARWAWSKAPPRPCSSSGLCGRGTARSAEPGGGIRQRRAGAGQHDQLPVGQPGAWTRARRPAGRCCWRCSD